MAENEFDIDSAYGRQCDMANMQPYKGWIYMLKRADRFRLIDLFYMPKKPKTLGRTNNDNRRTQ